MDKRNGNIGRGRGRGFTGANNKLPFNAWGPQRAAHGSNRENKDGAMKDHRSKHDKNAPVKATNNEKDWKERETARESRLEKVRMIKQNAAENFGHLLEESDSSDEELREEEILRKTMDSYEKQFQDPENVQTDLPKPSQCMSDMLQAGETTCSVCIDPVKHVDQIWSCLKCFGIFHIQCIQRWARQNIGADKISSDELKPEDSFLWCCPNCRHNYEQNECPAKYFCFCGKEEDPKFDPWIIPHSCGQKCSKLLTPACGHECLLLCHPGPCPPCPKTVKIKCHCGRAGPSIQRCSKKEWSCGSICDKILTCGHHKCFSPCHSGLCPPCPEKSIQPCICQKNKELRDCSDPIWKCNEICGRVLPCGNHTCEEICHTGGCGECPRSGKRNCPCGKMSLQLPCMEDIPLCEDTCGKMLECGRHTCHRQCHNGECETCRQIVTKACRCGRCSKELPCCQLFTCDFKCTKMRSCKRHPCKRKCCDGNCPPCEQTCNRNLSCRNHKCPAQCHTGFCFPCPLKKEISCFCGSSSITVNCGAEKWTKPPRCKKACTIPSTCHHETREFHKCHFNRCPPCRQTCNLKLQSCDHYCPEKCHDEIPIRQNKPILSAGQSEDIQYIAYPCPPCQVPIQRECYGKHEVTRFPCSEVKPYSCKRKCGRKLECGNHICEFECHVVKDPSSDDDELSIDCMLCEEPCLKPRPKGCNHICKRPCHPDECPPCTKFVRVSCHCGLIMMEIKCSVLNEGNEEVKSCKNRCPKLLSCGHRCTEICHPGNCPQDNICNQKVKIFCPCKRRKKETRCNLVNSDETSIECDEKCKELKNEEKKAQEEKEALTKAEELKKQQEELEKFKRKTEGRKRKTRKLRIEEELSLFSKYKFVIITSIVVVILSILIMFLVSTYFY